MTAIITDVEYRMALPLIRDLRDRGVTVIACYTKKPGSPLPYALGSKGVSHAVSLPDVRTEPEACLKALTALCRNQKERPVILPVGARTLNLLALKESRAALAPHADLCLADSETLDLANDKARLAALAREIGVPVPEEYAVTDVPQLDRLPYPVVLKPLCGEKQGLTADQRYVIAKDARQAADAFYRFTFDGQPPVVQQYLPGGGLGCSVLAKEGEIINIICHERIREYPLSGGPSTCCRTIDPREVLPHAQKLVKALNFTGPAMIEFKRDANGHPRLLEINPRLWGTFPLTRVSQSSFGYDWFALAAGKTPERKPPVIGKRMYYLVSDARRALAAGPKGLLDFLGDWLLPKAREGIFEWSDPGASFAYLFSYLRRGVGL